MKTTQVSAEKGEHKIKLRLKSRGGSREFGKERALYVGDHRWPAKKILGFRWPKKAEIT